MHEWETIPHHALEAILHILKFQRPEFNFCDFADHTVILNLLVILLLCCMGYILLRKVVRGSLHTSLIGH